MEYQEKLAENRRVTEAKAAKNRAKRQRAKERQRDYKRRAKSGLVTKPASSSSSEESSESEHEDKDFKANADTAEEATISNKELNNSEIIASNNSAEVGDCVVEASELEKECDKNYCESKTDISEKPKKSLKELLHKTSEKIL